MAVVAQKAYFRGLQCRVVERSGMGAAGGSCLRPIWSAAADKELTAFQRRLVQLIACGGVWTNQRLCEAGYDVSPVLHMRE